MKYTTITTLTALLLGTASSFAQGSPPTAFTDPSGFVTVNVAPAPSVGTTATTAFSVSLRSPKKYTGKATSVSGQVVTVTGAGWTPTTQWVDAALPHLLYINNASGAEAFLITGNTADSLTVAAGIDLATRFANDADIYIVEATTLARLFGATAQEVEFVQAGNKDEADNVYLRYGDTWTRYWYTGTKWTATGLSNENNVVVYPDDGVFVIRRSTTALALRFTGSVPVESQLTSVPSGSTFVGSRFPVQTKIKDMGFLGLTGWVSATNKDQADNVYLWENGGWTRYWHTGTKWTINGLSNNDDDEILGNAALFIIKNSAGDGVAVGAKPYDENQ